AAVPAQGLVGCAVRRAPGAVHHAVRAGDDPAAAAAAPGAGHPGGRRGGPLPVRGAGLVRPAGRRARRGLAGRAGAGGGGGGGPWAPRPRALAAGPGCRSWLAAAWPLGSPRFGTRARSRAIGHRAVTVSNRPRLVARPPDRATR